MILAYKIMAYDPETNEVISGADSRLRFPLAEGSTITMPGQGIWMGSDLEYVKTYYGECADHEAILTLEIDESMIIEGNITDREAEFTTRKAKIISFELQCLDDEPAAGMKI